MSSALVGFRCGVLLATKFSRQFEVLEAFAEVIGIGACASVWTLAIGDLTTFSSVDSLAAISRGPKMQTTSRGPVVLAATRRTRVAIPRVASSSPFSSLSFTQSFRSRPSCRSTSVSQKHPSLAKSNRPKHARSFSSASSTRGHYDGMPAFIRLTFGIA
jgi:hypothetical protein